MYLIYCLTDLVSKKMAKIYVHSHMDILSTDARGDPGPYLSYPTKVPVLGTNVIPPCPPAAPPAAGDVAVASNNPHQLSARIVELSRHGASHQ